MSSALHRRGWSLRTVKSRDKEAGSPCANKGEDYKTDSRMSWELTQVHLVLLYFLTSILMNIYKPLIRPLTVITHLASQWVITHITGLFILWRYSLEVGVALFFILCKKLWAEMLASKALWQFLATVKDFCLYLIIALLHCARGCTMQMMQQLKQEAWAFLSSMRQWVYHWLVAFYQENKKAWKTVVWRAMRQAGFSLFFGLLDGMLEVLRMSVLLMEYGITHIFYRGRSMWYPASEDNTLDAITSVLPTTQVPLSNRFKGPATSVFKDVHFPTDMLRFMVVSENKSKGPGRYGLEATGLTLHERFQSCMRIRKSFSVLSRSTAVRQAKMACTVFIVLYLSAFSIIVSE